MQESTDLPATSFYTPHFNTFFYSLSQYYPEYKDTSFNSSPTQSRTSSESPSPLYCCGTETPSSLGSIASASLPEQRFKLSLKVKHKPKMTKNGILDLYVSHASHQITKYEKAKKPAKISRALIELELLIEIDKASFPIEFKMAWYNAIISSSNFESFWLLTSRRLKLPPSCTKRYVPDDSLLQYDASSPISSDAGSVPELTEDRGTSFDEVQDEAEDEVYVSPEAAALARRLGGERTPSHASDENISPTFNAPVPSTMFDPRIDPRGLLGDPNGLAREEGDDGGWGHPKKTKKRSPSKQKTPKAKAPPKERTTPAKPKTSKTPKSAGAAKRGFAAVADGEGGVAGSEVMTGSPVKKARKNTASTPRKRKPTAKAQAIAME